MTAENAEIGKVVEAIAAKSGVEIVLDKNITGKVTMQFKDVKFEEGLKNLLKQVVGGGFASEYVKESGAGRDEFDLRKVVIARQGIGSSRSKDEDVLRISEITVQEAEGKEVVFAKWGTGESQIPLLTETIDGIEFRKGFAEMRVGDDGTIYFVNWAHHKIYIYDKDGRPLKPFVIPNDVELVQSFEVDHEGNIYLLRGNKNGPTDIGAVYMYRPDGTHVTTVIIPASQAEFTPTSIIEDGVLKCSYTPFVYDFRPYLKNPDFHSPRRRYLPAGMWLEGYYALDEANRKTSAVGFGFYGAKTIGLPQDFFIAPYPTDEWPHGREGTRVLGFDGRNRFYYLFGIGARNQPYAGYGIGVFDPTAKRADYYRLPEMDTFVYERGGIISSREWFDVDQEGNVFFLFTTKEGVHIYKYPLGR